MNCMAKILVEFDGLKKCSNPILVLVALLGPSSMSGMKDPKAHSFSKVGLDAMKLVQSQLLPSQSLSESLVPLPSMSPYPCSIFTYYFIKIPCE